MSKFHDLLRRGGPLMADGAMGTMLFQSGLQHGEAPESWNLSNPEKVRAIQRQYIDAGANIVLSNSFGGTRFRLALHKLESQVAELNRAAVELLRAEIIDSGRDDVLLGGDIGPSGEILEPLGALTFEAAVEGFEEQARALIEAGADLIWIETMSSLDEIRAAFAGVRRVSADIPVVTTLSFDTHGRTMMGVTPEQALAAMTELGAAAVGANCGNGTDELFAAVQRMLATGPSVPIVAKSNAGMPRLVGGKAHYDATPEEMAAYALQVRAAGAGIIGACCGSSPAHIAAMAAALRANPAGAAVTTTPVVQATAAVDDTVAARVDDRAARRAARRARES
ncbi:MAG TPA: betaine--homocysteine S-methyltransferase [Anaerolineales bacterium]|nr:betaine--homocysteine S-methyltransferase [Anaerolineales bacterium]